MECVDCGEEKEIVADGRQWDYKFSDYIIYRCSCGHSTGE